MTLKTMGPAGSDNHIIIADDPSEQLLLAMALDHIGLTDVRAELVGDGISLLHLLETRSELGALPDLVVTGLDLPHLDGHHVLASMARHERLWRVPVLVWTADTCAAERQRCCNEGAMWFVERPGTFAGYVDFAASVLERARIHHVAEPMEIDPTWAEVIDLTVKDICHDLDAMTEVALTL